MDYNKITEKRNMRTEKRIKEFTMRITTSYQNVWNVRIVKPI